MGGWFSGFFRWLMGRLGAVAAPPGGGVCGDIAVTPRVNGTFAMSARVNGTVTVSARVNGTVAIEVC